jgi:hypothetical protein
MENVIQVSFTKDFIAIQSASIIEKFPNLIAVHKETNKIFGIGETEEEISKFNSKVWLAEKHKITFRPIYDFKKLNPDDVSLSIHFLLVGIHKRKKQFRKLTCKLEIPGYELQGENRESLEYQIQSLMKFRDLFINNVKSSLSGKMLILAMVSLEYGRWAGFALLLYLTYINVDFLAEKLGFSFLLFLALEMAISVWAIEVLWLIIMKTVLSKEFVRLIFQQGHGTGGWSTSKTLANLILGKE